MNEDGSDITPTRRKPRRSPEHAAAAKLAAAGVAVRKARTRVVRAKAAWKSAENALLLLDGAKAEALAEFQRVVGASASDA